MKFYFRSKKETENFKGLKKKFLKRYNKYIKYVNFDINAFTSIKYLPPKLEEKFDKGEYNELIDFLSIQLPAYYREGHKIKIKNLLNDLWAIYLKKFQESTSLREI